MNILYYTWNEYCATDAIETLEKLGHNIHIIDYSPTDYDCDPKFTIIVNNTIEQKNAEAIFTFNYWPILSISAEKYHIPYISWIFDMPHHTLLSPLANKNCNHIFIFDRLYASEIAQVHHLANIYHLPLAVNTSRLTAQLGELSGLTDYNYDISFVGSLYENGKHDQIVYLPDKLRGYLDGIMQAQQNLYGYNLTSSVLTPAIVTELEQYIKIDMPADYLITNKSFYEEFINKKISSLDRIRLLNSIAERFPVALFTNSNHTLITNAHYKGIVDYESEMPQVFRSSKINLNITIRSIVSGIPLRALDIIGSGGFLLSNYQPELDTYFVEGEDMVMFDSEEDLLAKVEYYLSHEKERMDIAQNGFRKAQSEFTYDIQLNKILSLVCGI